MSLFSSAAEHGLTVAGGLGGLGAALLDAPLALFEGQADALGAVGVGAEGVGGGEHVPGQLDAVPVAAVPSAVLTSIATARAGSIPAP